MIALAANILIRAVMGLRVPQPLETYAVQGVRFCPPDAAFAEAVKYLPALLRKNGKPETGLSVALSYLQVLVEPVFRETYDPFEEGTRQLLRGRDEDDWPMIATALAFECPIWTEDTDIFGTGIAVWTTRYV